MTDRPAAAQEENGSPAALMPEELPYRVPKGALGALCVIAVAATCLVVLNQKLNLGFFIGKTLIDTRYLYLLATLLLPLVFVAYPSHGGASMRLVPWYDLALAGIAAAVSAGFLWTAETSLTEGWEYSAPTLAIAGSAVLSLRCR